MSDPVLWVQPPRQITDGQPVSAATINQPFDDLWSNDNYLRSLIELVLAGEATRLASVSCGDTVLIGHPVFHSSVTLLAEPAMAAAVYTGSINEGTTAESSLVLGVVAKKPNAVHADLVTGGLVRFDSPPANIERPDVNGPRYLSTSEPGGLLADPPSFPVLVGYWIAQWNALLVRPSPADLLGQHKHLKFELAAVPAGTANNPRYLERHTITAPNSGVRGWLPAPTQTPNDGVPVINGVRAKFYYNLARDNDLFAMFPPVPLRSAHAELSIGGGGSGRKLDEVLVVTQTGIWWMRDDWGWAPWAPEMVGLVESTNPPANFIPPPVELQWGHGYAGSDRNPTYAITLWFLRVTDATEGSSVTSITAIPPIFAVDSAGNPASTGNLRIGADMSLSLQDAGLGGGTVIKDVDGLSLLTGPVVSGIRSANSLLTISGGIADSNGFRTGGDLTLAVNDPSAGGSELRVSAAALDGARQENTGGVFYLGLPHRSQSAIRGRIDIPFLGNLPTTPFVRLKLRILATSAGTLPDVRFTYRRIPPINANTAITLPGADQERPFPIVGSPTGTLSLAAATGQANLAANSLVEIEVNAPIPVAAGETLFFTVSRGSDGYAGTVGMLRFTAYLVSS